MISYLITKDDKFIFEGECGVYASGLYNNLIKMASDKKSVYYKCKFIILARSKNI